ncbi:MAG: right-handed parallel beta-helix repeat-containing protein, partial [Phycisphaerae bacterium]|nr:right-handed parallel beta-helix repeat-containing protein [Phycisphaerae bacterium]
MTTLASIVVSVVLGAVSAKADFTVAPNGNDGNPGTQDKPFASLARAKEAVRSLVAQGLKGDVTVLIRGGTYRLDAPLIFGTEDSGTGDRSITYAAAPGEKVVISGGRVVKGWKQGEAGKWVADVPSV